MSLLSSSSPPHTLRQCIIPLTLSHRDDSQHQHKHSQSETSHPEVFACMCVPFTEQRWVSLSWAVLACSPCCVNLYSTIFIPFRGIGSGKPKTKNGKYYDVSIKRGLPAVSVQCFGLFCESVCLSQFRIEWGSSCSKCDFPLNYTLHMWLPSKVQYFFCLFHRRQPKLLCNEEFLHCSECSLSVAQHKPVS